MTTPPSEFAECHVLVVEDNRINQALVAAMLEAMGVGRVVITSDGIEGMEHLAEGRPDLVILDLMMPRMDGFEFMARMKADPGLEDTPVLVTTALSSLNERVRAFDAGAADYVIKPIDRREFKARVSSQLRTRVLVKSLRRYQDRLSRDLEAAHSMQQAMLPTAARIGEVERRYGVRVSAAGRSPDELSGDIWDVIAIDDDRFAVYLADFTGHGIAAAINTFRLQVMMARELDLAADPAALLGRINRTLHPVLQRGQFATMVHAVFSMADKQVRVSVAGAPPPIHRGKDTARVSLTSLPLGLVETATYQSVEVPFHPGEGVLLFSDGLSEAHAPDHSLLGESRIREMIESSGGDMQTGLARLAETGWSFEDDVTAIWVGR